MKAARAAAVVTHVMRGEYNVVHILCQFDGSAGVAGIISEHGGSHPTPFLAPQRLEQ